MNRPPSSNATLSPQQAREIFEKVLKFSSAAETEATISWSCCALTRFANNTIHQNLAEEVHSVSVRVALDGRTARATTNRLDDESLRQACAAALALARLQPADPNLLPMPGPQTYQSACRFDPETAALTPQFRARTVAAAIQRAERDRLTAAGICSDTITVTALFNSRGLAPFHEETLAEFSITMLTGTSSGWAKKTSWRWADLEPEQMVEEAAQKALVGREPRELMPGKYTVILEPAAVLDVLGYLVGDFSGLALHEKRSCLTGRLGQKLFGSNITFYDDVYHPSQSGLPFDGEGMPRQRVLLVENGVVRNVVYARQTAQTMGTQPTGHGLPLPNELGEVPVNIVVEGGNASIQDMIRTTSRGLLITRVWYIRDVDPYKKIVTGMTRDGTFWIEDGEVRHGVKNLRFNQSIIDMLTQVEMMSPSVRASGEEAFDMVVPAMKICEFNFSSVSPY